MNEEFVTYRIINNAETALDLSQVLNTSNILFYIEEDTLNFDPSYANNAISKDYRIRIKQQDFAATDKLFEDYYQSQVDNVERDYYLYEFSSEELQEILAKRDEWGLLDYELAKKILLERGIKLDVQKMLLLKTDRTIALAKPEAIERKTVILLYILTILFPPVGVFTGLYWTFGKKTLPDGRKVLSLDQDARNHGMRILAIGLALLAATIAMKLQYSSMSYPSQKIEYPQLEKF